jgi:CheY-like chemotaxis protein
MSVTHAPNVRVIDDNLDVRKPLSDILRIKGCEVASAENAAAVLRTRGR